MLSFTLVLGCFRKSLTTGLRNSDQMHAFGVTLRTQPRQKLAGLCPENIVLRFQRCGPSILKNISSLLKVLLTTRKACDGQHSNTATLRDTHTKELSHRVALPLHIFEIMCVIVKLCPKRTSIGYACTESYSTLHIRIPKVMAGVSLAMADAMVGEPACQREISQPLTWSSSFKFYNFLLDMHIWL